jgi:hypothetical protein
MRWNQAVAALICLPFLGCAPAIYSNYKPGDLVSATVGNSIIDVGLRPLVGDPAIQQQLLYGGLSGETVKVTYLEFQPGYSLPRMTQDVQYDLSKSKVIAFQGMRLEVVEVNTERIVARVLPAVEGQHGLLTPAEPPAAPAAPKPGCRSTSDCLAGGICFDGRCSM